MHQVLQNLFKKNKKILNIAFYGDSIFASGYRNIPGLTEKKTWELPFRGCEFLSMQKYLYDRLDYNRPKFFNIRHPIFKVKDPVEFVGSNVSPNAQLKSAEINPPRYMTSYALLTGHTEQEIEFSVTGDEELVLVFESFALDTDFTTGAVTINIQENDLMKKTVQCNDGTYRISDNTGEASRVFDTSFKSPVPVNKYNGYAPVKWMHITGLDKTARYTVTLQHGRHEKPVRFWGIFQFTGQTLFVHNESKPGFSWNGLYDVAYADLKLNETDLVILEAPMYHDKTLSNAEKDSKRLIDYLKKTGAEVVLCACTPGSVAPVGRLFSVLGAEDFPVYLPGENLYVHFNRTRHFHTEDMKQTDIIPTKGDVYEADINGKTYEFICNRHIYKDNPSLSTFILPLELEGGQDIFPLTLTRKKGKGKRVITYRSMDRRFTMEEHRDLMQAIAKDMNCIFVDLLQAFKDEAKSAGETLETKGYPIPKNHFLYEFCMHTKKCPDKYPEPNGPYLMNHMTMFFNPADGHHLEYPAHEVVYKKIAEVLEL